MRYRALLFIPLLIIFNHYNKLFSQTPIRWISGIPGGEVTDLSSKDGIDIKIIGHNILSTSTNAGLSWSSKNISTSDINFSRIIENNSNIIVVGADIGNNNYLFISNDNGNNWKRFDFDVHIFDIAFITESEIIITCSSGIIYMSNDYGQTWQKSQLNYKYDLLSISKTDNRIYMAGSNVIYRPYNSGIFQEGIILFSEDNGYTWDSLYYFSDKELKKVIFKDNANGVALITHTGRWNESQTELVRTTNGGKTWEQKISYSGYFYDICYLDNSICLASGSQGIYRSWDGGNSWARLNLDIYPTRLFKLTKDLVFSIGSTVYKSSDTGNSWLPVLNTINVNYTDIQALDSKNIYVIRMDWTNNPITYYLCKTSDGGETWETKPTYITQATFSFINKSYGTLIGHSEYGSPMIFNTTDGGNTWNQQTFYGDLYLWKVCLYDQNIGFILATDRNDKTVVVKTTDGGINWAGNFIDSPTLLSITNASNNNWFAAGYGGTILHSSDQGATWDIQTSGTNEILMDLFFIDTEHGFAVGENGIILKTNNSGKDWININNTDLNYAFRSVAFKDSLHGVIVGNEVILITKDGGLNWEVQHLSNYILNSVTNVNNVFFISGENGILLKIDDPLLSNISRGTELKGFYLSQNYPNPFNPTTKIEYSIPSSSFVALKVYDLLGREVATLVNEEKPAGNYEFEFDGNNLTSGIYFYTFNTNGYSEIRKMLLLK